MRTTKAAHSADNMSPSRGHEHAGQFSNAILSIRRKGDAGPLKNGTSSSQYLLEDSKRRVKHGTGGFQLDEIQRLSFTTRCQVPTTTAAQRRSSAVAAMRATAGLVSASHKAPTVTTSSTALTAMLLNG